jgi:L-methionine (R)-S-oxide reductase
LAEDLHITKGASREKIYEEIIPQITALISGETDLIANLANLTAALKEAFNFLWVGFYIVKSNELVLGPFQGPVACTRIQKGKGVCGTAWLEKRTIIVPNVEKFPGHIACSSLSKSEIVIPVLKDGNVIMVLDIDSDQLNDFSEIDKKYLSDLMRKLEEVIL